MICDRKTKKKNEPKSKCYICECMCTILQAVEIKSKKKYFCRCAAILSLVKFEKQQINISLSWTRVRANKSNNNRKSWNISAYFRLISKIENNCRVNIIATDYRDANFLSSIQCCDWLAKGMHFRTRCAMQ